MRSDFSLEIYFTTVGNSGNTDGNCVALLVQPIVHKDGVVQEIDARVPGKGLELLSVNSGRFEINQLLFADDKH